jgi:hypothetical protein
MSMNRTECTKVRKKFASKEGIPKNLKNYFRNKIGSNYKAFLSKFQKQRDFGELLVYFAIVYQKYKMKFDEEDVAKIDEGIESINSKIEKEGDIKFEPDYI